jgi:hypothetical protein
MQQLHGEAFLQQAKAHQLTDLRDYLLERAALARRDPVHLLDFVMREETTRQPITCAPHQKVGIDFVMHHNRSVNIWPVNHAKTFSLQAILLWLIGNDPTGRGVIVSATQAQAAKVLRSVRDYIEEAPHGPLGMVFPELRRSMRDGDPWTQTDITVDRPWGIRDPTVQAIGLDSGRILGSRVKWFLIDDVLNQENTNTKDQRDKTANYINSQVLTRADKVGAKIMFTNTPWHVDDLLHRLEKAGWPTIRMTIDGEIQVQDDLAQRDTNKLLGLPFEPWDHEGLRPANPRAVGVVKDCRLTAHDPDPRNSKRLWPEAFTDKVVADIRHRMTDYEYNRSYRCIVHDDDTAMCKREYVETCLAEAQKHGVKTMVTSYQTQNMVVTGVDLAISPGEESDDTALVTVEFRPDGYRRILDIEIGKFSGPQIVDKLFLKHERYNAYIHVESNAAQDFIRQFALQRRKDLPVKGYMTGRTKAHPEHGIPGIFVEMSNGAWLFPNENGRMHPHVQRLVDECVFYVPSKHTGDVLMAMFFARELAKKWGATVKQDGPEGTDGLSTFGSDVMSR